MSSVTDIRSHQRVARMPRPGSTLRGWLYRLGWHGALVDDRTRLDSGLAREAAPPELPVLDPSLQRRFRVRILGAVAFLLLALAGSAWLMRHRAPAAPNVPQARHRASQRGQPASALPLNQGFESLPNQSRFLGNAGELLGRAYEIVVKDNSSSHRNFQCIKSSIK